MKQIGMFTSMFPGGKTQSEEFREAAEKDKHRKHIVNAAGKGDEKKLQLLLTKYSGIDLNEKINDTTPLMAAASNGKLSSVKLLLLAGADPYVKEKRGLMALELARKNKHKDVAEYLLNNMGDQEIFKILKGLGFARYWEPFVAEQVTIDQFKKFTDADYDRMGLPIGPRKQIQRYLKDLEKSDRAPRMPRSASDALASPRGRLPNGPSAQSAPLGKGQHNYVDVPPTTETARTSSLPQIDAPPESPRNRRSPSPPLSASSPSAITAAGGGLGSSASSTGVGGPVPRTPRGKKAAASKGQYVDYDKFDDDHDVQQRHGNSKTPRRASDAGEKSSTSSPVGGKAKAKGSSPGGKAKALGNTDRKLMGQYVDYQEADFSGETPGAEAKKAVSASPKRPKKAPADNGESNYIYGGVGNLEGGEAAQEKSGNTNKAPVAELSDNDSSSDDSDSDDSDAVESESESESDDSEVSSDEGPGDERKYGYREIDYEELVFGKKIGAGAFGAVYKGTWRGAPVAIKKLKNFNMKDKHMVEEFRREAKLAELVHNHPNIVKFVGACSKRKGKFCLVTMFCSGGSLDKILRDPSVKIELKTTVRMAVEAASGLYHLHCEGVIHRDIAARNCLVGENYHIFVTDFGFARIKENATAEYARTLNAVGPVKHMSPEAMREKKYSEKSDAFSFGVLLWEMFTRKEPYEGEKDLVALAFRIAVQGHRLTIPPSVPAPITLLMKDCWETDPHKRPSFRDILKRLSAFANTLDE